MNRTITKIERQNRNRARYNIYVDDEYATSVHEDVLVRCRLSKGQVLQDKGWTELLAQEEENKARQSALKYVGYKPRTAVEVKRYLKEKGFAPEFESSVLAWLESYGYVNDRAFAKAWVEERRRVKGKGSYALRQELQQKGVDDRWIAEALDAIDSEDELQLARKWAYKRYERVKYLEWEQVERRIGSFLQRKGFQLAHITEVLQELRSVHSGDEDGFIS